MAPTLNALNDHLMHRRLRDTSAKEKRNIGVCDVELDVTQGSPARQKNQRMKMKNTRLEGYLVNDRNNQQEGRKRRVIGELVR